MSSSKFSLGIHFKGRGCMGCIVQSMIRRMPLRLFISYENEKRKRAAILVSAYEISRISIFFCHFPFEIQQLTMAWGPSVPELMFVITLSVLNGECK